MSSEKLFMKCSTCGKEVSTSAKSCPQCGAKLKKLSVIQWVGIVFLSLIIIGVINSPEESSQKIQVDSVENVLSEDIENIITVTKPVNEIRFISVIKEYVKNFSEAKNELQQSLLRDRRKQDISRLINSTHVKSWVGTINQLSTNSEGKAILSVRISPYIEIKTWNNALSDIMANTLIEKGTLLYKTLIPLSIGQKVKFSGSFFQSPNDYIEETSVTIQGSMQNPEFLFKFESVELIK